jgi:MFS family permease
LNGESQLKDRPWWILPVIVVSQFAGGSLWFAGNAIIGDLPPEWHIDSQAVGTITSAVQLGFIVGTFVFAVVALADRFSPRLIFFACSLLGALTNLFVLIAVNSLSSLLAVRFLTGLFLAGIYPIGMKIAAGWYRGGLGKALGFLVGALVVGTASPHLVRGLNMAAARQFVILSTSITASVGGLLVLLFVPNGPYLATTSKLNLRATQMIFRVREVRASVFSYFGHMWELYTFWAFTPFLLAAYSALHPEEHCNVSLWSFFIIGAGSIGCAVGGMVSRKVGSARVAFVQLCLSGVCCLLLPVFFGFPFPTFVMAMIFWGIVVVGDSPQFSALTAAYAPKELVGSALTIANCIGFGITILSIQLTGWFTRVVPPQYIAIPLVVGPVLGLMYLRPLLSRNTAIRNLSLSD